MLSASWPPATGGTRPPLAAEQQAVAASALADVVGVRPRHYAATVVYSTIIASTYKSHNLARSAITAVY